MDNRKRLPTPATVAPVPGPPLLLGDRGRRGPVRERAPGGAAQGVWGCKPPAWERHRRGGDRLGGSEPRSGYTLYAAPRWGA